MIPGKQYAAPDYARMAWRRRWFIVMPFVACILTTLIVSSKLANLYTAETLLQIVPQQVPDAYVRSTVTLRTENRLNALNQQVMSRTELERLILSLDLYADERARFPMQDVIERMREDTVIDPVVSNNDRGEQEAAAFYIRFTYPDARVAARVTERLGSLFIDRNSSDRGALAETTDEFLQSQLAEARKRLEVQEEKLERFREQHAGRLPSQLQFNMQAVQNVQLQVQALSESLARDRDRKLMLERLYNDAQDDAGALGMQSAGQPDATQPGGTAIAGGSVAEQLSAARLLLAKLELNRKPEHPDVIRTKRQIANLEKKLAALEKQDPAEVASVVLTPEQSVRRARLQQMRAEIESLDRQIGFKDAEERRLRGVIAQHQGRIEAVPGTESEWTALSRDYDTQQEAYRDLLSKSQQAKLAANLERRQVGEQFRILDPARVPEKPVSPKRILITGIGFAAGLFIGLALAGLMEFRDQTFRKEAEVAEVLDLPVMALIPAIESAADRIRSSRRQLLVSLSLGGALFLGAVVFWSMKLWRYVV